MDETFVLLHGSWHGERAELARKLTEAAHD